ncbi:MAG TPA: hypothetical protein VFS35_10605 [Terrimicrobiaceae bacterium]|nr:hypothetical protein [Terrimicrobiaceae bacterium]
MTNKEADLGQRLAAFASFEAKAANTVKTSSFLLVLAFIALAACDRTPGVRSSQGGGGPANAPATERSPSPSPSVLPDSANPDYFRGLGVAEGLTPGVAVGLASGVAVGIAVGDGSGLALGVERPVMSGVGVGCGVTRRIPDGIPGAASRSPFGLASLAPFLFGAGPVVDGAVVDAPVWLTLLP